jgi:5'-nucleotidase (lipoprotein e(P4) family)
MLIHPSAFKHRIPLLLSLLLTGGVLLLPSCRSNVDVSPVTGESSPAASGTIPTQEYLIGATLFVQTAAEYRALCYQAYNLAGLRLVEHLKDWEAEHGSWSGAASADGQAGPAIVTDLDETVLDNSAYTAWQIENEKPYSPETWAEWTALAEAPLVPGAADFLHLADSLGVRIFYVSNRKQNEREATMRNMAEYGLPQLDTAQFFLKTTSSDKTERREAIAAMGYDVLLYLGDNLGDYDARWDKQPVGVRADRTTEARADFGDRFIVFPNPLYGSWEGALYRYDWGLSMAERDAARREALEAADLP